MFENVCFRDWSFNVLYGVEVIGFVFISDYIIYCLIWEGLGFKKRVIKIIIFIVINV